jgi:hypothetical protein
MLVLVCDLELNGIAGNSAPNCTLSGKLKYSNSVHYPLLKIKSQTSNSSVFETPNPKHNPVN